MKNNFRNWDKGKHREISSKGGKVKSENKSNPAKIRFRKNTVGVILHSLSGQVSEIELEASKDIDKIKKDVMYYYADKE